MLQNPTIQFIEIFRPSSFKISSFNSNYENGRKLLPASTCHRHKNILNELAILSYYIPCIYLEGAFSAYLINF